MRRTLLSMTGCVVGVAVLVGCTGGAQDDGPSTGPSSNDGGASSAPSGSPDAVSSAPVEVTRQVEGVDVTVAIAPVQVRDGVALLSIEYALGSGDTDGSGADGVSLGTLLDGASPSAWSVGNWGPRLVDVGEKQVFPVGADAEGSGTASEGLLSLTSDEPVTAVSMHAAPASDSVDVLLPAFGYVADVPVAEAGAEFDAAEDEVGVPAEPAKYELRSFTGAYDDSAALKREDDEVTVSLTSDVLFDSSSAELSGEATKTLDKAAEEIRAESDGGTVHVVGHTDDVDSDAFNQKLSEQRAGAVASQLTKSLGSGYTVKAEGRGESEPVAQGTSDEARAANRRVDVVFKASKPAPVQESSGSIPETDLPTSSGNEAVEYSPVDGTTVRTSVESVERRDGLLVGTLAVEAVEGGTPIPMLLGETSGSSVAQRGFGLGDRFYGAQQLALLAPGGEFFGMDYLTKDSDGDDSRRLLGDEYLDMGLDEPGDVMLATVVWPDTGQDAVTVEANDRFRITDVPVTDGAESD